MRNLIINKINDSLKGNLAGSLHAYNSTFNDNVTVEAWQNEPQFYLEYMPNDNLLRYYAALFGTSMKNEIADIALEYYSAKQKYLEANHAWYTSHVAVCSEGDADISNLLYKAARLQEFVMNGWLAQLEIKCAEFKEQ
jgi:hypothetical protein